MSIFHRRVHPDKVQKDAIQDRTQEDRQEGTQEELKTPSESDLNRSTQQEENVVFLTDTLQKAEALPKDAEQPDQEQKEGIVIELAETIEENTRKSASLRVRTFVLVRSFLAVAGWTGLSRVSGVIREILFASIFGASIFSDIYTYALKLPSFFRRFFAEGALSAVLVPRFSSLISQNEEDQFRAFSRKMFSVLAVGLILFVLLFEIAMPNVINLIAPGFRNNISVHTNIVHYARLFFPYIWFISLVALMSGMLNSMNHFSCPAAISIVLNGMMILGLLVGKAMGPEVSLQSVMHLLGFSILTAGFFQCAILWRSCRNNGLLLFFVKPKLTPAVRSVLKASIPGMIGASVMQINVFVDMAFASLLPVGSASYLHYADRLNQLPLSLLGAALGTTLLPPLSKYWKNQEVELAHATQNRALSFGMLFVLPATVGLFVAAEPIVHLLYGHGKFDNFAIYQTMIALKAFVIGLPAYVLTKIFSAIFFAHRDTKTPVIIAGVAVGLNATLNFLLKDHFAHVGIAMATAISSLVNAGMGWLILSRRGFFILSKRTLILLGKACLASLIMGGIVQELFILIPITTSSISVRMVLTLVPIISGLAVYLGLAYFFRLHKNISEPKSGEVLSDQIGKASKTKPYQVKKSSQI